MSVVRPGEDGTVSLAHRQLAELRTRNRRLESRLRELIDTARANERRFAACRDIAVGFLQCRSLDDVVDMAVERLPAALGIDCACLLGADASLGMRSAEGVAHLLPPGDAFLGNIRPAEAEQLFDDRRVQSVAIVALSSGGQTLGFLALGSHQARRFATGDGTMFVQFIAETTAAALDLHRARTAP